jgi:hypothetical protein
MLYIGQPNHVTFKVTVAGSSSEPEARVFVGSNPALCFGAVRDDAGVFHADVMLPPTATTGDTDFRVEVLLNNRVFVPIKKSVPVIFVDAAMVSSIEEMPPVEEMPEVPSIEEMSPAEVVPEVPPVEDVVTTTQVSVKTTTAPMSILGRSSRPQKRSGLRSQHRQSAPSTHPSLRSQRSKNLLCSQKKLYYSLLVSILRISSQ